MPDEELCFHFSLKAPRSCLAVALLACSLGAGAQELPALLALARAQSPEVAAMRLEADAAAQRVQPAGALPDPVLRVELMDVNNYGSERSPNLLPWKVGETKYTLMQTLPGWGKRELRREQADAQAREAEARAAASWAELAMRVKSSYAELARAAGSATLTRELLALGVRLEQAAQLRYAQGLAGQQDALRAQLEQTAMRGELLMLEAEQRQLLARLNGLLARPAATPLADPPALPPLPVLSTADAAGLAERARLNNPLLRAEQARLAAARKGQELVDRNRYPDLNVGISPSQMGSRITTWGLMLELNLPLQQGARRSQEREAAAMAEAARARSEALTNQLLGELAGRLAALEAARQSEQLIARQMLPQAELALQSALAGYESGKAEFAMLLEAQGQIRRSRMALLKTQVEARMALAEIERLLGEEL
ncbi:TolC family protein [Paucibacter sediminis]|uniref:TolC family protein n=1 Tax=Paucibacter sediminis TaxID=3019553 RepID=A0AA95NK85_9BURK|nr:TolC family protein [Paucibacter sp. S2-9]WIT14309.1 TolC family protein [Paucibacter sp. S2-9]